MPSRQAAGRVSGDAPTKQTNPFRRRAAQRAATPRSCMPMAHDRSRRPTEGATHVRPAPTRARERKRSLR